MWRALAPLVAARRSVRLWDSQARAFEAAGKSSLPRRVPSVPAAVPIFTARGTTTLLALDFDAKRLGAAAVDADVAKARQWLTECGARLVEDRSTSGGAHLLIPLYAGTPFNIRHVTPALRLLADRLPTLDLSPMTNSRTGCITPPGSACREGGHRRLVGSLDEAADTFLVRSDSGVLARLVALLGHTTRTPVSPRAFPVGPESAAANVIADRPGHCAVRAAGTDRMCLSPALLRSTLPLPPVVAAFAEHGTPDVRWPSSHEARQSVLAQAAMRGFTLSDVLDRAHSGEWAGFADAYDRYRTQRGVALARDWAKACHYVAANAHEFRSPGHRYGNTGGQVLEGPSTARTSRWLACATAWVDSTWPRSQKRWTVLAVLQALAYMAVLGGEEVNGTIVVAVGGRTLSTEAGLMPETTLWETLAELRELPGSPILRTRQGAGLLPDAYALVAARTDTGERINVDASVVAGTRIEPVHAAWRVLGLHTRRIYEAVAHRGVRAVEGVFTAARIGRSAGYEALAVLTTAGLLERRRGQLSVTETTLDAYAEHRRLHHHRADRIERHRLERALWRDWLEQRFEPPPPEDATNHSGDEMTASMARPVDDGVDWDHLFAYVDRTPVDPPSLSGDGPPDDPWYSQDTAALWQAIGAADPTPPPPEHAAAVRLLTDELGATVLVD